MYIFTHDIIFIMHHLNMYQGTDLFHDSPRSLEGRKDDLPLRPVDQKGAPLGLGKGSVSVAWTVIG